MTQTAMTRRSPIQAMKRLDSGIAISEPTAVNSKAKPSPLASASSRSRTAGMREAQVANSPPLPANTTRVAQIAAVGDRTERVSFTELA